ncbi:MAG: hypothetical protein QW478_05085 [Candidatus Micrarchaeaceae archaeon]
MVLGERAEGLGGAALDVQQCAAKQCAFGAAKAKLVLFLSAFAKTSHVQVALYGPNFIG